MGVTSCYGSGRDVIGSVCSHVISPSSPPHTGGRRRVGGECGGHEGMEGGNVRKAEEGITET